ncbi:MAG: hypothetical protein HQ556_08295 [Candidatus Marinimicrobia bacterium]|nr:hypothetical protein [Candidatus Neomarinimicrobiota bacterium]
MNKSLMFLIISLLLMTTCSDPNKETFTIIYKGGWYGGGVNPSITETIIDNSGKIVITTDYLYTDSKVIEKQALESEIEDLRQFMINSKFVDLVTIYDCTPGDSICENVRDHYPPPNPLTVELIDNNNSYSTTVRVFQCTEVPIIDYPVILDSIVYRIHEIVNESY